LFVLTHLVAFASAAGADSDAHSRTDAEIFRRQNQTAGEIPICRLFKQLLIDILYIFKPGCTE